jgi:iron complex transport system substrate-binding protein
MAAVRKLFLLVFLLAAAGCMPSASQAPSAGPTAAPQSPAPTAAPSPTSAAEFPVTLTDDDGTSVTIDHEPTKIVSLTPATTEILFAIGAGPRVVAKVEDVANDGDGYPPEAASLPVVATFAGVDVEQIVALGADLVVAGGAGLSQGAAVEQLRRADIPVLVAYPTSVAEALDGIKLIGEAAGEAATAAELVDEMGRSLDDLAVIASSAGVRPRLFYEIDTSNGIFTPPSDSIYSEMFVLAGATPISGDANYSIALENLVAADPEVILLGDAAYGVTPEQVGERPGWGGMSAVTEDRIYPIDDIIVTRPGPRLVQGLYALIKAIHPGLVIDIELPDYSLLPIPFPIETAA